MADFRFRLQSVLELKDWQEKEQALAVARARSDAEAALVALQTLQSLRQLTRERLERAHGAGSSAGEAGSLRFVLEKLDEQIATAAATHDSAIASLDATLEALSDAVRDRQTLERLRTRQAAVVRANASAKETRDYDEIASNRRARGRGGEA